MRIVTAEEMKRLDRYAIETIGILGAVLMENAGRSLFSEMVRQEPTLSNQTILVACGGGNNGGDGLVISRYLHEAGVKVTVAMIGCREPSTQDAKENFQSLRKMGVQPIAVESLKALPNLSTFHVIVDALFGTGLERPLSGFFLEFVNAVNASKAKIYSADIPSGLHADTGEMLGGAVRADVTVTFGFKKRGFFLGDGPNVVGEIVVADISIEEAWADKIGAAQLFETSPKEVASFFPKRKYNAHKGTYGHVLIVGGSAERSGAVVLASLAALRSGVGLVTAAVPKSAHEIIKQQIVEGMTELLPDENGKLTSDALPSLLAVAKSKDAVVIGPGLILHPGLQDLLDSFVSKLEIPIVLDADGLNAYGTKITSRKWKNTIFTPHPGEMSRLMGISTKEIEADRIGFAESLRSRTGATIILKGAYSVIAQSGGKTYLNPTGNPAMATAGMGDVLSGIIGAYLAQGLSADNAALVGAYHHGLAGDRAAVRIGPKGLLARDVIEELPHLST